MMTQKYLGVDESDGIQHSKIKKKIRKKYNRRVRLILRTELNGRNKIEAINSLAVPVVQYSFGTRENELRERIPVPHDNFFKSI